ncbi:MAG TPA: CBS domain-containing protein [Terriglobia bacterium]|jgi:CBS domain-containing protein/sporulation protein YlmC with PRC-barrel domain|nr:CBS domain-containing protein [Terriglobia bacterium]
MIYYTELEHLPIFDVKGEFLGRLVDLCVDPSQNALRVASFLVRTPQKQVLCISYDQMQSISVRAGQTTVPRDQIRCYAPDEGLLRVKKDVLDQQIIDVDNRKVVRVNDIDFDIQPADGHTELRIMAVNVGLAAAIRRLLQGVVAKHTIRSITQPLPTKTIPWEFVNLIEPDPSRRVKLRLSYDRLAALHPADLADILEELSRDEQKAVIESLDDETAAQALSEIPTEMQAALLESIPPEKAADIVEEMPPDEAADVLQEMPPETSLEVLADMDKEEAKEVRELLGFEEKTAGALMTTECVVVGENATVEGAIMALKNFEGPLEAIQAIYLINDRPVLTGVVPLGRILLADANTPLRDLCMDPLVSVQAHADHREVIDLFHKYNLLSLPVVDEKGHLLGVITADDVLELLIKRT